MCKKSWPLGKYWKHKKDQFLELLVVWGFMFVNYDSLIMITKESIWFENVFVGRMGIFLLRYKYCLFYATLGKS
jgi:hypothetical protein